MAKSKNNTFVEAALLSKRLKKELIENNQWNFEKSVKFNNKIKAPFYSNDVFEVTISNAYFSELSRMGVISNEFEKSTKIYSSLARYTAFGSLSKTTEVENYFTGKRARKNSNETKLIAFAAMNNIYKLLEGIVKKCKGDYYFYWVDSIFIPKKLINTVLKVISKNGHIGHVTQLENISYKSKKVMIGKKSYPLKYN